MQHLTEKLCELCNNNFDTTKSRARFCSNCRNTQKENNLQNMQTLNSIYTFTPDIDRALITIYSNSNRRKGDIAKLSKSISFPRYVLYKRAKKLGITTNILIKWSTQEISFLKNNINLPITGIHSAFIKNFQFRTKAAIQNKLKTIRTERRADTYTAENLSLCMGVHSDTVESWIKKGFLPAQKIGKLYSILSVDIKQFIQYHPTRFNLATVDQIWFLDIVFDGKISNYKNREE